MFYVPPAIVQNAPETVYAEVYNQVKAGKEVVVHFGPGTIPTWAPVGTIKACDTIPSYTISGPGGVYPTLQEFPNGVYRCWLEGTQPKFQQVLQPALVFASPCANGQCPRR